MFFIKYFNKSANKKSQDNCNSETTLKGHCYINTRDDFNSEYAKFWPKCRFKGMCCVLLIFACSECGELIRKSTEENINQHFVVFYSCQSKHLRSARENRLVSIHFRDIYFSNQ